MCRMVRCVGVFFGFFVVVFLVRVQNFEFGEFLGFHGFAWDVEGFEFAKFFHEDFNAGGF